MKKVILTFLVLWILILVPNYSFALDDYAPQWEEFCPRQFVNAEYQEIYKYKPSQKASLYALTIVGIPYVWYEQSKHQCRMLSLGVSNYWVERRATFEREIKSCSADEHNATMCFMQVRQIENNKNAELRQQDLANQQMANQASYNLQNQIQAQQINNNLNQMNSNLNGINSNLNMMQMNTSMPRYSRPVGTYGW